MPLRWPIVKISGATSSRPGERIRRDAAVVVEAQHLAVVRVAALRDLVVRAADEEIEIAVRREHERQARRRAAAGLVDREELAHVLERHAAQAPARKPKSAPTALGRLGVGQVHPARLGEPRMDGHRHEPAAAAGAHPLGKARDRLRLEHAAAHDAQAHARPLRDEHVAVRQEREIPRQLEPFRRRHAHLPGLGRVDDERTVGQWPFGHAGDLGREKLGNEAEGEGSERNADEHDARLRSR